MVRLLANAKSEEMVPSWGRFRLLVPYHAWKKRIKTLAHHMSQNDFLISHYANQHWIEFAYDNTLRAQRQTGRLPKMDTNQEFYRLMSFAHVVMQVHDSVSDDGKKTLKGRIIDALKSADGFNPLLLEMDTAIAFARKGFNVEFSDLEGRTRFDLTVDNAKIKAEVECKTFSVDAGRKVHRQPFAALAKRVKLEINDCTHSTVGGLAVVVTVPDNLSKSNKDQSLIADRVKKALQRQEETKMDELCKVDVQPFDIGIFVKNLRESGNNPQEAIRPILASLGYGTDNHGICCFNQQNPSAVIFSVVSEKPDKVIERIHDVLRKEAGKQFSGKCAGYVFVRLLDITPEQLREIHDHKFDKIEKATALQQMTIAVLQKRPVIHSITYTAPGPVQKSERQLGNVLETSYADSHAGYTFCNPHSPFANDENYDLP